jgi:hypothetical protein
LPQISGAVHYNLEICILPKETNLETYTNKYEPEEKAIRLYPNNWPGLLLNCSPYSNNTKIKTTTAIIGERKSPIIPFFINLSNETYIS